MNMEQVQKKVLLSGIKNIKDSTTGFKKVDVSDDILPILDQYPRISTEELTRMAYNTGKGFFLTFGITRDAFKHKWIPKQSSGAPDQLTPRQLNLFDKTIKIFNIKNVVADCIGKARAYGQAVVFAVHKVPGDPNSEIELRSVRYERFNLLFEGGVGKLTKMRMPVMFGNIMYMMEIPIENCILFINGIHETGYPYLGRSELSASYYYIRSSMNIMDNWTKLFSQRGLGLLDIKIQGGTPEDIEKGEELYSDPTQYSALIHDENVEIKTIAGINSGYSIKDTNEMFMKEVSSASGVSYTKLDGGNSYVSGVIADQDNYAANFQLLHQQWRESIVKVIELCEPKLKDKISVDFEIEIKLDKTQMIQVQATFLTMVLTCPEVFTVNDLLRGLSMEIIKGGDEVSAAEYLYEMRKEIYGEDMLMQQQGEGGGGLDSFVEGGSEKDLFHERVGKNDEKIKGNVNLNLKNARKDLRNKKRALSKSLIMQIKSTPYATIGDSDMLDILKENYGEAISKKTLTELKEEVKDEVPDNKADLKQLITMVLKNRPDLSEDQCANIAFGIFDLLAKKQ